MKVVMITPYGREDGIAVYTNYLVKELKKLVDVRVYAWNYYGFKKLLAPFLEINKVVRTLRNADVVHVQYALSNYLVFFLPLLMICDRKARLVLTLHEEYNNVPLSSMVKMWHYLFYKYADRLIVHSIAQMKGLPKSLHSKTCVVNLGIPTWSRVERRVQRQLVLLPGFINPWKGHDIAIKAFSIIKKRFPKARLVIAGRGHNKRFLKKIILLRDALELNKEVIIKEGFLPQKYLDSLYSKAELGLLPYKQITSSAVLCDMISRRLPTLLSDIPVFIEATRGGAVYFKEGDFIDLAEKIEILFKKKSERDRITGLFRILAEEGSMKNTAIKILQNYS